MVHTIKYSDNIHILEDGYGCIVYLVLGRDRALLFDTGVGADDLYAAVRRITELPLLVIASHGHFDHIGGCRFFEKVYLSRADRNIPDCYTEAQLNEWLVAMGYPETDPPVTFGCGKWAPLADLDFTRFNLGGLEGEIIPLPGHSHGSVGVYFPALKVLLAGDALAPVMVMMFQNHGTTEEQAESVERALRLGTEVFFTGHNSKPLGRSVLVRMADCLKEPGKKRFYNYAYPGPPYGTGWITVHSIEDEPVGLILENKP